MPFAESLRERLEARRPELEQATLTRVQLISDFSRVPDPNYAEGLRAAVSDAIEYGLSGVENPQEAPAPPSLLTQARLAARNRVGLDTVLRRYFAGYALLNNVLIEEAEADGHPPGELTKLLRAEATLFDRLVAVVSEEYGRDAGMGLGGAASQRGELVKRLLNGELVIDTSKLAYRLDGLHLGAVAGGVHAEEALRELAHKLDCRLLAIPGEEGGVWAWLGTREPIAQDRLVSALKSATATGISLALGEPARGVNGWRLTHRQARAALPFALRSPGRLARYSEVALVASARQDNLLATSLRQLYLAPLETQRDGGETARQTLRAYFATDRNITSTAASLGVSRRTVTNRLHSIEECLGRSLTGACAEIEAALRLEELGDDRLGAIREPTPSRNFPHWQWR